MKIIQELLDKNENKYSPIEKIASLAFNYDIAGMEEVSMGYNASLGHVIYRFNYKIVNKVVAGTLFIDKHYNVYKNYKLDNNTSTDMFASNQVKIFGLLKELEFIK